MNCTRKLKSLTKVWLPATESLPRAQKSTNCSASKHAIIHFRMSLTRIQYPLRSTLVTVFFIDWPFKSMAVHLAMTLTRSCSMSTTLRQVRSLIVSLGIRLHLHRRPIVFRHSAAAISLLAFMDRSARLCRQSVTGGNTILCREMRD